MTWISRQSALVLSLMCVPVLSGWANGSANAQRKKPAPKRATQTRVQPSTAPRDLPDLRLEPLPEDPAVALADVAITARVKARELRFDVVPNASVQFPGQPARETIWEAERENLPTPVQPGVTYRNIGIRLKITSVFSDIDRIVAEALGEVPLTGDGKTADAAEINKPSVSPLAVAPNSAPPLPPRKQP